MYRQMTIYQTAKRLARKAGKAIKKRYVAKPGGRKATGGMRVGKMAKDIMYLKSVLNPEKKRLDTRPESNQYVGQVNGDGGGFLLVDCTPIITQGIQYNARNGASIKLHSTNWEFQLTQQVHLNSSMKFIFEVYVLDGLTTTSTGLSANNFARNYFIQNPFITGTPSDPIIDTFSSVNPDFFKIARCIRRVKKTLAPDQFSGQFNINSFRMGIKYNKGQGLHIRYNKDSNIPTHNQMFLVVRADRGNISEGASSTLGGIPDSAVATAARLRWARTDYYYDN